MAESVQPTWLEIDHADGTRRIPLLPTGPCRIGRNETSSVVLIDDLASRNHALIQCLDAGSYALVDLGSVNGTHVSGRRISVPTVLKNGDRITIGHTELRFYQEVPAAPGEPEPDRTELDPTNVYYAEKLISVLVVDIRDYTRLARKLDAELLSQMVRALFNEGGKQLLDAGSWAQKYIGDAVMAVWIHDKPGASHGSEVKGIIEALLRVVDVAGELQDRFGLAEPVHVGAGLNSGPASVGNVGSIAVSDYTAVGDVVNKAFRLESATKGLPCDLLVGPDTLQLLAAEPRLTSLLSEYTVDLKGYDEAATAWGVRFDKLARGLAALTAAAHR